MSSFDVSFSVFGEEILLLIFVEIGEVLMVFLLFLVESVEFQDFFLDFVFVDLMVLDLLWNIFDPGVVFDCGLVMVSFGLEGFIQLMMGVFNFEFFESDDVFVILEFLMLIDFEVFVVGVELIGVGDFIFDNFDMESFDGFLCFEGVVDFCLFGGNQLFDSLIFMGFVFEGDVMGVCMMMGFFIVVGSGEDELNLCFEVISEGYVLVNG